VSRSRIPLAGARPVVLAVAAVLGASGLAACGAGQSAHTAYQVGAVTGKSASVGSMLIRNATITAPEDGLYEQGEDAALYLSIANIGDEQDSLVGVSSPQAQSVVVLGEPQQGDDSAPDDVGGGTSPASPVGSPGGTPSATGGAATGGAATPSATPAAGAAETPGATPTATPGASPGGGAAAEEVDLPVPPDERLDFTEGGRYLLLRGLTEELRSANYIPVTFRFAQAGTETIQVPVSARATPTPRFTPAEEGEGAEVREEPGGREGTN